MISLYTLHSYIKVSVSQKIIVQKKMSSSPICVFVYVNGEITRNSIGNTIFTSDNTRSMLLYPMMMLADITGVIKSSITDVGVLFVITSIWYRCPIHEMNGHVEYTACPITDKEYVWCMFNTFINMQSVICMELRVEVHTSPSLSHANNLIWTEMEQKLNSSMKLE